MPPEYPSDCAFRTIPKGTGGVGTLRAPGKTSEVLRMQEPDGEGVAIRTGPESCAAAHEDGCEA